MANLSIKNLFKSYDQKNYAVNNVNIEITNGEFVVLVGPSGCGKSTILRMIAGLEDITKGEIFIDSRLVNNVSPKDRDIAMVFQNYALYPHMSVFENISFGLKLRKFSKEEINKRVNDASEILGLTDLLDRKPKQLSGGQRQRVALGRAIVRNPKVFLFDEPLSNLDAKLRVQMRTEISKLHKKLGTTMIYVTHDQTEAMTMGDKIVILNNGEVQQIDTPMNLYTKPKNKFVAGFIGSPAMNFLEGKIEKENSFYFISKNKEIKFDLTKKQSEYLEKYVDQNIVIGIRPEDFHVTESKNENYISVFSKIDLFEPLGNETYIYFYIEGKQNIARITSSNDLKIGSEIEFKLDKSKIHFFDSENNSVLLK